MAAVKPKDRKMSSNSCSLSHLSELLLSSPMRYSWVSVCVKQRGSLSIYTSFRLDNNLLGPTSLGESNNPSAPQLWGLYPREQQGGLTSLTLHDFVILMTLPIGTLGYNEIQMILPIGTLGYNIRYTSEYIPKSQIHQHSLLTSKVFS